MYYFETFKNVVKQFGDEIALVDREGGRKTNYRELDLYARRIAAKIEAMKIEKTSPILINMDRKMEYIAAYLGIMMAGRIAVPVVPEYPEARLKYIREDCKAKLTITDAFFTDLNHFKPLEGAEPKPDQPALIIYTSGSTGKPKGILHTYKSISIYASRDLWQSDIGEPVVFGAVAPLSFIAAFAEYFRVFAVGGCTHIIHDEARKDAVKLADYYTKNHLNIGFISPQLLKVFKNTSPYLKRILTGSERLSNVYYEDYEIVNVYGSSELGGSASSFLVDGKYDNTPIGTPTEGFEFFILDEEGEEIIEEEREGELCIKGEFAKEYLNLPENTKNTFVRCEDGSILFHTNDIVKKQADGNYVYINRKDWMVKINGQRVETGEIETLISSLDGVQAAAVKAFEDQSGQNYLVAYYAGRENKEIEIKAAISNSMPEYMMPKFIKHLDKMPINNNGKLDRTALLPPSADEYKTEYIAPTTPLEKKICMAFERILNCGSIGMQDDFFILGGDSIKVIKLAAMLEDYNVSPQMLFKNSTPEKLVRELDRADDLDDWQLDKTRTEYPLTASERGMFIEQKINPESIQYNLNTTFHISGVSVAKLEYALENVMKSHEAFRSYYVERNHELVRVVSGKIPVIRKVIVSSKEDALKAVEENNKPFILNKIPTRVTIYNIENKNDFFVQMCMHHIMMDGEGINIIVKELTDVLTGKEISSSKYDLSYASEHFGKNAEKDLLFFKEMFASGIPVNDMPVKSARLKEHPMSDTLLQYEIDSFSCKKLMDCAKVYKATLFEVLFSAASMTVGKYCVSEDVVLGMPKNTRDGRTSRTVGMFINTLPARVYPVRQKSVTAYVKEVSETLKNVQMHADCPFETIVNEFVKERDASRHPVFDVGINLLHTSFRYSEKGIHVSLITEYQKMGRDINLFFVKDDQKMQLAVQYSSQLFDRTVIENFVEQLLTILSRITINQDLTISQAIANPQSQQDILDKFNGTQDCDYGMQLLHKRFEAQVDATPNHIAVIACDRQYTYRQLDDAANCVANGLMANGFCIGDSAVVMLKRTSEFFPAILGVLKAGGSYIPTDPAYPAERIKNVINDSDSHFIITNKREDAYENSLSIDDLLRYGKNTRPTQDVKPEDLAYMIYTSGSTGKPKGVMIEHRSICNFLRIHERNVFSYLVAEKVHTFLTVTTVAFDMSMKELYAPLLSGKTLVFANEEETTDPRALVRLFEKTKADGFNATPSRIEQYLMVKGFDKVVSRLNLIACGGEKYPESLLIKLKELTHAPVINTYGPTEITVSSNVTVLNDTINVGKPGLNVHEYIVDRFGDELPPGIIGELYIGGMGVARGYKNLDTMTKERFILYKGMRIYKSGDYAKWTKNGKIIILGRTDNQVKLRGLRIELGEIEKVIGEYEGIRETAVAIKGIDGTEHLVAYFTADKLINISDLKRYLSDILTHYMVPSAYMQLDQMPYTLNGKKDIKSLPIPEIMEEEEKENFQLTKFQKEIASLVEKAAGIPVVSITKNLLQCGLTSLSAISFVTFVEEKYGCEIPVKTIMQGASIIDIENLIYDYWMTNGVRAKASEVPQTEDIQNDYPLTSNQMGVYYDTLKHPEDIMYNMPLGYVFDAIDILRLKNAIQKAVDCHFYMNTHIENREGRLVQKRIDNAEVSIPVFEIEEDQVASYLNDFVQPFSLHSDILYRFEILKTQLHIYLLFDVHHIIFDGLSRGLFIKTLKDAYENIPLEKETFNYFNFALLEEKYKDSEEYKQSEAYYKRIFSEFENATEIPADQPGRMEDGRIGITNVLMEKSQIDAYCNRQGVTASTLFLSAVFYTVSRFANTKDVYISTISGGRNNSKIRKTIGMFVKTLPLYMKFDEKMNVNQLIGKSNEAMLLAIDNESYPFSQISAQYGFMPDIMYECQLGVGSGNAMHFGDSAYSTQPMALEVPKFKVTVAIEDYKGEIAVSIRFNDAIYSKEYMSTFAESIKECVKRFMNQGTESVKNISMLSEKESRLIESFAVTQLEDTPVTLLHKVFENNADQYKNKTAIIACDTILTYQQLEEKANITANFLIEKGVKVNDKVTLLLPRKSNYMAAVLGVLKAGAAFIPCDPEYPVERINHIVTDSEAKYIITTKEHIADYSVEKALDIDDILTGNNTVRPNVDISSENLAYLIYTSGSTGKPKGVMLCHEGICNYLYPHTGNQLMCNIKQYTDIYLSVTTVSFDMSMKEIFASLCNGKTLVFAAENQMNDPRALTEMMKEYKVDTVNATPSRLLQYMEYQPFKNALSACKIILSGGEMYPISLRNQLKDNSDAIIMNTYGPTEITVSSNMAVLNDAAYISVGRPLANYVEYIVDSDENKLPHGVIGELYIGGPGVAKGYKDLPEMTKEHFVDYESVRVYKSGDYAKWDKDGNVIIYGRKDNQVKLRGLRIELGEIEGVIEKQEFIKKAVVVIKKINGVDNLCAYFTAQKQIDIKEFKEILGKSLTQYMVPTAYLQLGSIPVTPNGKTDIKHLPDPVLVSAGEYAAPVNETEKYFCQLFERVLKLEKVGATDDFFELGGTSLLVTSIVIDAAEKGYEITYGDIFRKTTPRALAAIFGGNTQDESVKLVDFNEYNYEKINSMLIKNNLKAFDMGELHDIGNIMLTGATGFMGIHVLAHFLRTEKGKAYCLLRKGKFDSPKKRLKTILIYYFGSEFHEIFEDRVEVFSGDVTNYDNFIPFEQFSIQTIFNCAANVKHFSSGTDIEDVNVGGVKNCIKLCQKIHARLIHFSTTSVAGASIDNNPPVATSVLSEKTLYYGQRLDTKYTNSKLLAEREVMEAVAEESLDGKVIRVGTLSARDADGEFQMNFLTNSFMGRLRSYMLLGCFPLSMMNSPVCLGPIDVSADAFFRLAKTPKKCCLFHAVNNHIIPLSDIIIEMNKMGLKIKFVNDDIFEEKLGEAEKDPQKAAILSSMLAYKNMAHGKTLVSIPVKSNYTTQILAKMGFFWKESSKTYIKSFIEALVGLGFFDGDNLNR